MKKNLHKLLLVAVPLLLTGAGVWYFARGGPGGFEAERSGPVSAAAIFGRPAAKPASPAAAPAARVPPSPVPVVSGVAAARLPEAYDPRVGIDLQGSQPFKDQVTSALKLIWAADRDTFLFIKRSLSIIRSENKTGFYMENGKTVAGLSDEQAFRSVTWCAGVIAHQAWHADYALARARSLAAKPPPLPGESQDLKVDANPMRLDYTGLDTMLDNENKAFALQLDVLRRIGAPKNELRVLLRRKPRDLTPAHDGSYSLNP